MNSILLVTAGYYPAKKYGGPVTSILNLISALQSHARINVLTLNHDYKTQEPYSVLIGEWLVIKGTRVKYLPDAGFTPKAVEDAIFEVGADVVYLNNFYHAAVSIPTLLACRKLRFPTLLAFRGELLPGAVNQKRLKKRLFIAAYKALLMGGRTFFQATSEEEAEAIISTLRCERSRIALLGNFPVRYKGYLEEKGKESGEASFIYIARIHPGKNLLLALESLSGVKGRVSLSIYGPIEDEGYWQKCLEYISSLPRNISVNYLGPCAPEDVEEAYTAADAMVLPTLTENYGHSIVEAMLAGCPVIISDRTPWTCVNEYHSGWALPLNDGGGFTRAMQAVIDMDVRRYRELRGNNVRFVADHFDDAELVQRYLAAFASVAKGMEFE